MDVRAYLESKQLRVRQGTQGNVHLACPFCNEDESKRGRLYVQTEGDREGCFICFRCSERGGINALRAAYGDPPLEEKDLDQDWIDRKRRQKALNFAADYYAERLYHSDVVMTYLTKERGLTEETIADARLGYADGGLKVAMMDRGVTVDDLRGIGLVYPDGREFFQGYITIPYFTGGHVSLIRGRVLKDTDDKAKYKTPLGQHPSLFGSDITFKTEGEITIAESELDSLVLNQLEIPSVAAPGVTAWESSWADYLKHYRRIYIMFDPDQAGKTGAEKVAQDLSPRSRIVELPPPDASGTKFDPTELYVNHGWTKDHFENALAKARGGLLKTAQDAYDEWLHMQTVEGLQLGYDAIDAVLKPGLLGGQVLILGASSGSGKTLGLLNIMHRCCAYNLDAKILFISLEQTEHEWFERARRIYRFYNPSKSNIDALNWWRDRIWIVDENMIPEHKMNEIIEQYAIEVGHAPDLVVVDYLGYWARGFRGEDYERTSAAAMSLKRIAKEFRVPIISPHQLNRQTNPGEEPNEGSLRSSGVVFETSDFSMLMWSPDNKPGRNIEDMTGERMVRLVKSRHGGKGHLFRFRLAPISLTMVAEHESEVERAKMEVGWNLLGDDFDTALWRHRTGIVSQDLSKYRSSDGQLLPPSDVINVNDF